MAKELVTDELGRGATSVACAPKAAIPLSGSQENPRPQGPRGNSVCPANRDPLGVSSAHVAKSLVNKGVTLGQLGRSEEAIRVFDEVLARFGERPEVPLAEQVAKALTGKALVLWQLRRSEDALRMCDEAAKRFGKQFAELLRNRLTQVDNSKP